MQKRKVPTTNERIESGFAGLSEQLSREIKEAEHRITMTLRSDMRQVEASLLNRFIEMKANSALEVLAEVREALALERRLKILEAKVLE